jgi:L-threonylcarbamoyladenylate synthase
VAVETLSVSIDEPQEAALQAAVRCLDRERLVVYPTDTLYAIGGRATTPAAGRAVQAAKGRVTPKPLPLVAADLQQVLSLAASVPDILSRLAELFWPGPLTVVLPAARHLPPEVTAETSSVALRIPAALLTRRLCALAGPLIATSANRAGEPAPTTCADALRAVAEAAGLALDGGPSATTTPSTIVDLRTPNPRLLRAGALPWNDVLRAATRITGRIGRR